MFRHAMVAAAAVLALVACGGPSPAPAPSSSVGAAPTASSTAAPTAAPTTAPTTAPTGVYSAWSIARVGKGLTIAGALPDEETRTGLVDVLGQVMSGAALKNELVVTPGARSPSAAGLGGLFDAIAKIPDFALKLDGRTLTLTGTAPSETDKAVAEQNAKLAFPDVDVVDDIKVGAAGGSCATLRDDAVFSTPITFASGGSALTADAKRRIAGIAQRVSECAGAKVTVVGHTDASGSDAINVPLSRDRAKAVADQLISDGVRMTAVASSGVGSAEPAASDATPDGRAQNRRVQVSVS